MSSEFIKILKVCFYRDPVKKMKRQAMDRRKIVVIHALVKGLYSEFIKELLQLERRGKATQLKAWAQDLNR